MELQCSFNGEMTSFAGAASYLQDRTGATNGKGRRGFSLSTTRLTCKGGRGIPLRGCRDGLVQSIRD